jgi:hypothetical protein
LQTELAVASGAAPNPTTGVAAVTLKALKGCAKTLGELAGAWVNTLRRGKGMPEGKSPRIEVMQNGAEETALVVLIKVRMGCDVMSIIVHAVVAHMPLHCVRSLDCRQVPVPTPGSKGAGDAQSRAGTAGTSSTNEDEDEVYEECPLPLTDATLTGLAAAFNAEKDLDGHVDNYVCGFLRVALGFGGPPKE